MELGRGFYKALGKGKFLTISLGSVMNPAMYVRFSKVSSLESLDVIINSLERRALSTHIQEIPRSSAEFLSSDLQACIIHISREWANLTLEMV